MKIRRFFRVTILIAAVVLAAGGCSTASPDYENQRAFDAPEEAVAALENALKQRDRDALHAIFGDNSENVLSSGDPAADRMHGEVIALALSESWSLEELDDDQRELIIGNENWPFPVLIVRDSHGWWFNTAEGEDEILARRIGRNELAAIGVCRTYVQAQREYSAESRDNKPAGLYAQKIRSEPGRHDGLYWPDSSVEERPSPLGQFAADAAAEGYTKSTTSERTPYYGYYYRILTKQGAAAPGGSLDYIINGEMSGGFALIAWPATYGNSGIMTFLVNQDGVVYQRDLGDDTAALAAAIDSYNPDANWRVADADVDQP